MHPNLNIAVRAARRAGDHIVQCMDRLESIQTETKGRNDYVTEVDRQAEQLIIETLRDAFPDHAILGEESGEIKGNDHQWVIDPLDGTTNFIHRVPHFCVSIALQIKNRLELAVIYDPIRHEMFTSSRGYGAKLNDKRIRVTQHKTLEGSLIGTGFPYREGQASETYLATFNAILPQVAGLRRPGAAALDLAYVAAGRFDGFWEMGLQAWDMAAGVLLIREAGGFVSDLKGGENYFTTGDIVAGNPKVFKALLQTLHPIVS